MIAARCVARGLAVLAPAAAHVVACGMVRLLPVALAASLTACATPAAMAPEAPRPRPLAAYAQDPFAPINLYVNPNEQLEGAHARLVEYAAQRIVASGAFARVDRGVSRWPITIQARYEPGPGMPGNRTRRVLSVLTLGLVPVHLQYTHRLVAEVFAEPESLAALELSVAVTERISLYDLGDRDAAGRAAIDALLERLLAEIAQRKLIPRWKTFEPEPEPKRKKKKTVPGRST